VRREDKLEGPSWEFGELEKWRKRILGREREWEWEQGDGS
jgi:hypothetical protein